MTAAAAPLADVRVLDLSRILAGPWCTQLLADAGADVIKIERPNGGDDTRRWGPPFLDAANGESVSAYFLCCNRGKRSVAIDFANAAGARLVRELGRTADVLVENFLPGTLARYGLDYATLSSANPRLVYCSITGFGQSGPNAHRPGYDAMIQAEGGLMSLTGPAGGEPTKTGIAVSDLMCGMYASNAILAALHGRGASGRGTHVDLALFDTLVGWLANQGLAHLVSGALPRRLGNAHPSIAPYQTFATADGYLMLAVGNDDQFARLGAAADCRAITQDARFADNASRVMRRDALVAELEPVFARRTTADWLAALDGAGVPCGPVNTLSDVFAHSQVKERGLVYDVSHPQLGALPQIANPVRADDVPWRSALPPPRLGEHTAAVLATIGVDEDALAALATAGVVGTG
jgi:crotonobetainyl-CoA:carnitine CoA-transferase CaiB-like acyl-CoA transferase